jgi:2-phospho-L-lactate guanylyltransferase
MVPPLLHRASEELHVKVALLPAKPLSIAKTRLAAILDDADRMRVAEAMFADVLHALCTTRDLDRVIVVTADPLLAARATSSGALVIDEGAPRGLNGAVNLGTETAIRLGAAAVVVVLSDLPLIRSTDIEEIVARMPTRGALVVPCKEGTGTNAMLRRPPTVLGPCFGGRSLERHAATAERAGVACEILRNARIEFDLDTPEDLRAFAGTSGHTTATHEAVRRIGAAARPTI